MSQEIMEKFKVKRIMEIEAYDLDGIIQKEFPKLVDNPKRFENFECIAEFEWNNTTYDTEISRSDLYSDTYEKYGKKSIMSGTRTYGLHNILLFMLDNGLIEEGEYYIDASW